MALAAVKVKVVQVALVMMGQTGDHSGSMCFARVSRLSSSDSAYQQASRGPGARVARSLCAILPAKLALTKMARD